MAVAIDFKVSDCLCRQTVPVVSSIGFLSNIGLSHVGTRGIFTVESPVDLGNLKDSKARSLSVSFREFQAQTLLDDLHILRSTPALDNAKKLMG